MSFRESINRPFYSFDYEDDNELLIWLNDIYQYRNSDGEEIQRIQKQTTQLALYLNYSPANQRVYDVSSSGSMRVFEKRDYFSLIEPLVKDIINNWVSRITSRQPSFSVSPKRFDDPTVKTKADKAKTVLEAKFQEQHSAEVDEQGTRSSFVFGESYLEILWDEDAGPLDKDVEKYLDECEDCEEMSKSIEQVRIGDVRFQLHDPRNVIVQRSTSYKRSEWVTLLTLESTEKLRLQYPDLKDRITESTTARVFSNDVLSPCAELGKTIVMKFYHRPTSEMPQGYMVMATQDAVLSRSIFPSKRWIKNARFPVLQQADLEMLGCSRGVASSVMDAIMHGQIALNNLWIQAITNIAMYSPKLLVAKNSLDMNQIRVSERNIITYSKEKPSIMAQEVVSQGHLLLIDKLRDRLLKTANVMPVTRGDSIPNVESRQMLDFMKDQESNQSIPKDVQHGRFLKEWATITFELMADKYEKDEQRDFQYFGRTKRSNRIGITGKDLQVDVDINIDNTNMMTGTLEGRMQKIQQVLQIVPNYYSPSEIVEILEIGSADKVIDEITAAIENARNEVGQLLSGKEVLSPTRARDLFTHYDIYVQEMQKEDVQSLLPESYDPTKKDIGTRFLNQLASIEMLLLETLDEEGMMMTGKDGQPSGIKKGDMPIFSPKFQIPQGVTYRQYLYGRHPEFPRVYKSKPIITVDPFAIQQPMMGPGGPMGGGMPPMPPMPMGAPPQQGAPQ